jgi:ribosomal protein S19
MKQKTRRRGMYFNPQMMDIMKDSPTNVRFMDRATLITNKMVGLEIEVHNGKGWRDITINETMVGYRVGSFIDTKDLGPTIHHTKKNLKKKRKLRK